MPDPSNVDTGNRFLCVWKRSQYTVYFAEALDHSISVRNPTASLSIWKALGESRAQLAFPVVEMDNSPEPGTVQPEGLPNGPLKRWTSADVKGIFQEHILIYIMSNLSLMSRLSADVLTEQQVFYGYNAGWGFQILICLATFLVGFSLAGLFRSVIVEPPDMVWPGILGVTALNQVLHGKKKEDITSG